MREQTLKILAVIASILTLPVLYFSTSEPIPLSISGRVIETHPIKNGKILTLLTPLPVVLFANTTTQVGDTIQAFGKLAPYQGRIEFVAERIDKHAP